MSNIFQRIAQAPICPFCGKKKFKKSRIAKTAAEAMTVEKRELFSAYYCKLGKAWHIGHTHKSRIHKGNFRMTDKPIVGLGIDPGQTGAIAVVNDRIIEVCDYTSIEAAVSDLKRLKRKFDIQFAVLEKIWVQPGDEPKRVNVLVRNAAMWDTLLHVLDINHEEYAPGTWRKGLVSTKKQKNKANYIKKAQAIWPDQEFKRHDQAEAGLMAYRAWQHIKAGWITQKKRA